ncbi:hypothetical protein [Pseudoflavonifractor sp. MSJ-37]|uniref:hypothetical protein n=1 Tax=Pseudoflavonifractor sp. MSJ-37 TaxID=2841531 RepID=UPI001C11B9B3|nr:hypothetical protein [Pseudoflavonifractor sp. MSJ-37]MBU5434659.1 hypothetical protein [Pseudoflavonifractor sp. MSJ-37]
MKHHMKRVLRGILLAAAVGLLMSGCDLHSDDDLYHLPELPTEFKNLTSEINEVLSQGAEYAAPLGGENIQNIQLQDMDGDGAVDSAIVFFRMSGEEESLKICIYHQLGETYELEAVIEGSGTGINYVDYVDLDGVPGKEVVVSWQLSEQIHFLAAYSVSSEQVVELLQTNYSVFKLFDMDRDGDDEILILNTKPEGGGQAELYDFRDGLMELDSTAALSAGISSIQEDNARKGTLEDHVPALFVTSDLPAGTGETGGQLTDILVWEDRPGRSKSLRNITLDPVSNVSVETRSLYTGVRSADIDKDGIMEVPASEPLPEFGQSTAAVNFWLNRWYRYDMDGVRSYVRTTYYNKQDGWYLDLPEEWDGRLVLSRSDTAGGGERAVVFSFWDRESGQEEPEPFLEVYRLSGSNRTSRAVLPGRFRLGDSGEDTPTVIYAAELLNGGGDCGLDEDGVKDRFHVIQTDWDSFDQ